MMLTSGGSPEQTQPEHEFRVFRGSTKVRGIHVFNQLMDKRKIDHLVYLTEKMVLKDDSIIKVAAIE